MSTIYPKAKEKFLSGAISMLTDTIKCVLLDGADYVYSVAHEFLSSVPSISRVGTAQTLSNKTVTNGVFDADNITFPSTGGDSVEYVLLFKDTGNEATSPLIALFDCSVLPNGGDITLSWDNGANRIFVL